MKGFLPTHSGASRAGSTERWQADGRPTAQVKRLYDAILLLIKSRRRRRRPRLLRLRKHHAMTAKQG